MAFNLTPKNLSEPTQELLGADLAELITKLAEAVAEGQARLDLSSAQVLQELARTQVSIVPSIRQIVTEEGAVSYEQASPVQVSLLELGMLPTFFAFSEATVEVAMDLKVVEQINSSGTVNSRQSLFAATKSLQTQRRLNRDVSISTKMTVKLVPVPPPSRLNVILNVENQIGE
jgi:hypothetical protein